MKMAPETAPFVVWMLCCEFTAQAIVLESKYREICRGCFGNFLKIERTASVKYRNGPSECL